MKMVIEEKRNGKRSKPKKRNIILAEMDAQAMRRAVNGLPLKEFICQGCGKPFLASPRRKNALCDKCIGRRERWMQKEGEQERSSQSELTALARGARAAGVSYGRFCAPDVKVRVPENLHPVCGKKKVTDNDGKE